MGSRPKVSSGDRYFPQDDPETRQHYANVRIREWQRQRVLSQVPVTFAQLLHVFVLAGEMYDSGCRLGDDHSVAA